MIFWSNSSLLSWSWSEFWLFICFCSTYIQFPFHCFVERLRCCLIGKHNTYWQGISGIWGQFQQHFTCSFLRMHRSQKCKKDWHLDSIFVLLESARIKATCKMWNQVHAWIVQSITCIQPLLGPERNGRCSKIVVMFRINMF